MSVSSHLQELKRKHQILSEAVEEAQRAPGSSDCHTKRDQTSRRMTMRHLRAARSRPVRGPAADVAFL